MPHLILEYSENLEFDARPFFKGLHQSLVDTGAVRMKGLKSRAIKLTETYFADGYEGYKFVHLTAILREGRSREVKEQIANVLMDALEAEFGHLRDKGEYVSLSTNMMELEHGIDLNNNNYPLNGVGDAS